MERITQDELDALVKTKSELEWNAVCDAVKKAHNGYPQDWYAKVIMSGLLAKTAAAWDKPGTDVIKVSTISLDDLLNGRY